MLSFKRTSRIVAANPFEVEGRRFLPSVMVTTMSVGDPNKCGESSGHCTGLRMRPVSVVEQGPNGTFWHPIPNTQVNILSAIMAMGFGTTLLSVFAILIKYYTREQGDF
jgi:hypothetical protein